MSFKKIPKFFHNIIAEWRACAKISYDIRSQFRLSVDFALSRLLFALPRHLINGMRQVRTRDGTTICYRLNRGDLQSIREVWLEEAYRLLLPHPSGVLLDLGANIGLTSVWLAKRYRFSRIIAVEPVPDNAVLVRRNLELNGIKGVVLEAAIGPREGMATFQVHRNSNQGRLSDSGVPVAMVTVESIIKELFVSQLDLIKVDIEGGEQELFLEPTGWLDQTEAIIIEFHPLLVDCPGLIRRLQGRGFEYIAANTVFPNNMDCFRRPRHARDVS